jgi:hypothetical protein
MLNRDVLWTDPTTYRIANDGVAKVAYPPPPEMLPILEGELRTFVCDGAYADGLAKILEQFNAAAGRAGAIPAVWISGFYGSGKSHLAATLAALWTNLKFPGGAEAEGLVQDIPKHVAAALRELRSNAARLGGVLAGGDTLGFGSADPVEAVLAIILKTVGLPTDLKAARVALWLHSQGLLAAVQTDLGTDFERATRQFLLDDRFPAAVLRAKPSIAPDEETLVARLEVQFGIKPETTVDLMVEMAREALTMGRRELPLTLIVLDEVQQFIREDANLTLKIQTIVEQLSTRFDGRLLVVCTGQQALTDTRDLQKLLGRFSVQVPLGSADIDAVIRRTVLRKKDETRSAVEQMLDGRSGEIHKHLASTKLAHTASDNEDAVADWPILPTRRRLWERVLRELDRSGLGGTLRGQLRTSLDAVKQYGNKPLGHAIPVDFLYGRFSDEAFSRNLLSAETRDRIEKLRSQNGDGPLKARILMIVYLLSRIAGETSIHGVAPRAEIIADLLVEDLSNSAEVRSKVPFLLDALQTEGAVIDVNGEWRLQTKESADWASDYQSARATEASNANGLSRTRAALLQQAIEEALAGATQVQHGASKTNRKIERVVGDDKPSAESLVLRLWNGWDHAISVAEKDIAALPMTDATMHLVVYPHRDTELRDSIITMRATDEVLQRRGPQVTEAGRDAKAAMESRRNTAELAAKSILRDAVQKARLVIAGGAEIGSSVSRSEAVKDAAQRVLVRLYPEFPAGDHPDWEKVIDQGRKRVPDALKAVGHTGEPQDHPVCKAFLKALKPSAKGSELRSLFSGPRYGWPVPAVEAAALVLANPGQIRVTGPDGKPANLPDLNSQKFGTCTFTIESRVVSAIEKIKVRSIGTELGLKIPSGDEASYLPVIIDRLENAAKESGGDAPAPEAPRVPGIDDFRAKIGNDLLAALAEKADELRSALSNWKKNKSEIDARLRQWHLARTLVEAGAEQQRPSLEAVYSGRTLLANPNPLPPIIGAAADDLRFRANNAFTEWQAAWDLVEARLASDPAWNATSPEKQHEFRKANGLQQLNSPDLSTPEKIAESLQQRRLADWKSEALALVTRGNHALRNAAIAMEPKTQHVSIPRRTLRTPEELKEWLDELNAQIGPRLCNGPVYPVA